MMVKVEMLVPMAGPKVARNRGDIVEVSIKDANRLTKAGFATLFRGAQPENTASKIKTEKAAK